MIGVEGCVDRVTGEIEAAGEVAGEEAEEVGDVGDILPEVRLLNINYEIKPCEAGKKSKKFVI